LTPDHGKTLTAHAEPEAAAVHFETEGASVVAVAVGQHRHLVADLAVLAPGVHDEYVVYRHAGNDIDVPGHDFVGVFDKAGKVIQRAGRCKRARYGHEYDFLVRKKLVTGDLARAVVRHHTELARRHPVAYLDRH
jgi:hypothetical protein